MTNIKMSVCFLAILMRIFVRPLPPSNAMELPTAHIMLTTQYNGIAQNQF